MEVLLNAFWMLIAAAALAVWGIQEKRPQTSRQRCGALPAQLLALGCALLLLFPVISLTDDLHSQQAVMEDSSRPIMKARQAGQALLSARNSPMPARLLVARGFSGLVAVVMGRTCTPEARLLCLCLARPSQGRSPPELAN